MNRQKDNFNFGIGLIIFSIALSLFAFISEENKITGYVVNEISEESVSIPIFENINGLSILSPGQYYIDGNGLVHLTSEDLDFVIARVESFDESQLYMQIYIDKEGRIGYVLDIIENG